MAINRSDAVRTALMDALVTQRGTSARIEIRTLTNTGSAGVGKLLALITGHATQWGTTSAGVLTGSATTADTSAVAGTAAHYELLTSASTFLEDGLCDVGGTDGVTIDNATITTGQTVQISGTWNNTAAY